MRSTLQHNTIILKHISVQTPDAKQKHILRAHNGVHNIVYTPCSTQYTVVQQYNKKNYFFVQLKEEIEIFF